MKIEIINQKIFFSNLKVKNKYNLYKNLELYKIIFKGLEEKIIINITKLINLEKSIKKEVKKLLNEPKILSFNKKNYKDLNFIKIKEFIKELNGIVVICII